MSAPDVIHQQINRFRKKHVINKKPFELHVNCVTQPEMCRYGFMYSYIQNVHSFFRSCIHRNPHCARHVASVGIRSKVNEYTPQHTEYPGHGTAWHQGSSSPRRPQWCLGSHRASSYRVPPNPGTPRANLHEHTHQHTHVRQKMQYAPQCTISVNNHLTAVFSKTTFPIGPVYCYWIKSRDQRGL